MAKKKKKKNSKKFETLRKKLGVPENTEGHKTASAVLVG